MGFDLNTKGYELFIQIEVGLREFMIDLIKKFDVNEWTKQFLGTTQREMIDEVVKRIEKAYKEDSDPNISDQYIYKLTRVKKEPVFKKDSMYHPFYYLNWNDIESLLRNRSNINLIDNAIGKLNREALVDSLKPLSHLRNDIAHSRFISEDNYKFIKASFDKISSIIPQFNNYINNQTTEQPLDSVYEILKGYITRSENSTQFNIDELSNYIKIMKEFRNSFWLNRQDIDLVDKIKLLEFILNDYSKARNKRGGALELTELKKKLNKINIEIKHILYGEI